MLSNKNYVEYDPHGLDFPSHTGMLNSSSATWGYRLVRLHRIYEDMGRSPLVSLAISSGHDNDCRSRLISSLGYTEYIYTSMFHHQPYHFPLFTKAYLGQELFQPAQSIVMSSSIKNLTFLALATGLASVASAQSTSGTGTTTRYW
jgi:hypothetical protein